MVASSSLNDSSSIVACGMVSQYNISDPDRRYGVKNLGAVVGKRLKMQGFIVSDANMGPKYAADHQKNVAKWISEGTFKVQQSVTAGIDNAIKGFLGMLKGENFGKSVLTIEDIKVKLKTNIFLKECTNSVSENVSIFPSFSSNSGT